MTGSGVSCRAGTTIRLEGSLAIKLPPRTRPATPSSFASTASRTYAGSGIQYLVASSQCYGPYFGAIPRAFQPNTRDYQRIFAQTEEVARFGRSAEHPGPELLILKVKS